jgi:preprotein translocase SecE subunit
MAGYKKDQGRMARMAAFWTVTVLLYYGCASLRQTLSAYFPTLKEPLFAGFPKLPVVGVSLTAALLISLVVFGAGVFLAQRYLERPKQADLLIETEAELRKVTWPTGQEVFNSSMIVVVFVLFLMGFLAAADWFLARLVNPVLF